MLARIVFGLVCLGAVLAFATTSLADPNLTTVPPHRHWLGPPADGIQIGPRVCDNPRVQGAFDQFHNNGHIAMPGSIGDPAWGFHDGKNKDIVPTPCSFLP